MVPRPPRAGAAPTLKELFARKCFLLGITEPARVERLWEQERAKYATATRAAGPTRRRR